MTITASPPAPSGGRPAQLHESMVLGSAALSTSVVAAAAAVGGLPAALLMVGTLAAAALFALCAWRPIIATYSYVGTVPLIAGIERDALVPLVRPNEALLALVLGGAAAGYYLRGLNGDRMQRPRTGSIDRALLAYVVFATVWPLASLMLRGQVPAGIELASILPICKLAALYVLVRLTVRTSTQVARCLRLVIWPASVVAAVAFLQTLGFPPVLALLGTLWNSSGGTLTERGSTTLGSSIATGDVVLFGLVLVVACAVRGLLDRRELVVAGALLGAGVLAAGQFSTWIGAIVAAVLVLMRRPDLRRQALRFFPLAVVAIVVGAPAFISRLDEVGGAFSVPRSWLGRSDNLTHFYLPPLGDFNFLWGVSPNTVLPAPETWRTEIFLESGYLALLWIGGIPLLLAFGWLTLVVLRRAAVMARRRDGVGAAAMTLEVAWWTIVVLSIIDIHLVLRGAGDVLFVLLAISALPDESTTTRRGQATNSAIDSRANGVPLRCAPPAHGARNVLDVSIAFAALVVLALPMAVIAIAVKIDSPGPAIFRQRRVGRDRVPFTLLKFRTMPVESGVDREAALRDLIARELRGEDTTQDGSTKLAGPVATGIGAWLRRTSLDELPQLINVLRRDMSLVGPRPCLEWEAAMFPPEVAPRFAVRPGLTGLWQVSGRSTLTTPAMLRLDTEYVHTRSVGRDLAILARTVPTVLGGGGAR